MVLNSGAVFDEGGCSSEVPLYMISISKYHGIISSAMVATQVVHVHVHVLQDNCNAIFVTVSCIWVSFTKKTNNSVSCSNGFENSIDRCVKCM